MGVRLLLLREPDRVVAPKGGDERLVEGLNCVLNDLSAALPDLAGGVRIDAAANPHRLPADIGVNARSAVGRVRGRAVDGEVVRLDWLTGSERRDGDKGECEGGDGDTGHGIGFFSLVRPFVGLLPRHGPSPAASPDGLQTLPGFFADVFLTL